MEEGDMSTPKNRVLLISGRSISKDIATIFMFPTLISVLLHVIKHNSRDSFS